MVSSSKTVTLTNEMVEAPVESKRELAKAKTRRALLKSALKLYSLEGACGMSMNKIAKGAGIAQPSFYNHFASLDELQNELSEQLKHNYLSPMRSAWITMLKDYATLTHEQFNERCQYCLTVIFDAAFQNIDLFQRLIEDSLRDHPQTANQYRSNGASLSSHSENKGLGRLIGEIKEEWAAIFIQGLVSAEHLIDRSEMNLCVDVATAQVHVLILGCHQLRYSRQQAVAILCKNFDAFFRSFSQECC